MANLVRRESGREVTRGRGPELPAWEPLRMMDALLRWDPFRSTQGWLGRDEFVPSFDLKETGDAYILKADLPGVKEEDIELSLTGNTLNIGGSREEERRDENDRYYAMERSYGRFVRTFSLPEGVDVEGVKAQTDNGVLTVTIPKKPEVQPKRITIGKGGVEGKAKA
jgi:HSP20 family protein